MENSKSGSDSYSNLLCEESFDTASSSYDEDFDEFFSLNEEEEDDDEYMKIMLAKEISGNPVQIQESGHVINTTNWIKEARLEIINYILDTQAKFEFKIQTAYLAITYFDIFLSRMTILDDETFLGLRLLGVSCLTLAAKMEEERVIILSEFLAEDYNFDRYSIKKTEFAILDKLKWRMEIITPFTFIHYLVSRFCQNSLSMREIKSRVVQVILVATKDGKILHIRPSVVAAGAALWIMDKTLTKDTMELKINMLPIANYLQIDDVFKFYNHLKENDKEKNKLSNISEKSPLLSPVQQQRTNARGTTSVSTTVSIKRKGLDFNESEWKRQR